MINYWMTVQKGEISVVTQHPPKHANPGIHAATQTIARKMNCSFVLPFAILKILMSSTPFPSEQGSNGQQLPILSDTFYKACQPQQVNMNRSSFTSDSQQARAEKLRSKSRNSSGQQMSPYNHVIFSRKRFFPLSTWAGFYRQRYPFQFSCAIPFILGVFLKVHVSEPRLHFLLIKNNLQNH